MRGVVRFALVIGAMFSAASAVGCAAGTEDPLDPPPALITSSGAPRKVFRASPADPAVFDATGGDRTTYDGSRVLPPAPVLEPPPAWAPEAPAAD